MEKLMLDAVGISEISLLAERDFWSRDYKVIGINSFEGL